MTARGIMLRAFCESILSVKGAMAAKDVAKPPGQVANCSKALSRSPYKL